MPREEGIAVPSCRPSGRSFSCGQCHAAHMQVHSVHSRAQSTVVRHGTCVLSLRAPCWRPHMPTRSPHWGCTTCTGASRFGQSGASPPAQSQGTASPPSQSQAAASPPGGAFNNAAARSAVASPPSQAQGVASPPAQQQGVASPPAQQQVRTALDVHCCCARSECILPSNLACC